MSQVKALDEQLKQADKEAGLYNSREALLGMPLSDYSAVKKLIEQVRDPLLCRAMSTRCSWLVSLALHA
jgi:hypothetical protein